MHRQDTLTINANALAEMIRERQLKQWWLARQIGVAPLTVNRWLTGKVRRISRDNLSRLAAVLSCSEQSIVHGDAAESYATQVEQSEAASLLISAGTQNMFIASGQYESYEKLLRATMHPNMSFRDLEAIYSSLCMATAAQGKYSEARQFAGRALDYALRMSDDSAEISARNNLISLDGETGKLQQALTALEELISQLESLGFPRGSRSVLRNLIHAWWLSGEMRSAIGVLHGFGQKLSWTGGMQADPGLAESCARIALECARPSLARALAAHALELSGETIAPDRRLSLQMLIALSDSLGAELCAAPDAEARSLIDSFCAQPRYDETTVVWPAALLRRAGEPGQALELLALAEERRMLRVYDQPFIAEERARIALALGREGEIEGLLEQAREGYLSFGMQRRARSVGLSEIGSRFRLPTPHVQLLEGMLTQSPAS